MLSCQIKTYGVPQHLLLLVIAPSPTPSPYTKKQKNNVNSSDQSDMHTLLFMYEIMRWKPPRPKYTYTSENNKLCVGAGSAPVKPLCPKSCDFFQNEVKQNSRYMRDFTCGFVRLALPLQIKYAWFLITENVWVYLVILCTPHPPAPYFSVDG